jgi:mono/diheme cytochrome c family protein
MPTTRLPLTALLLAALPAVAADGPTGEQVYRTRCASCHGAAGEGTKEHYPKPLAGDRSPAQLARLISRTMPEDDPGTLTDEEANRVAAYVHDAFYSKAARERNRPPRVELARLTVRQYQNALADLLASFRPAARPDDRRGLRGEYFATRRFRNGRAVVDRVDPEVRFDFKDGSPDPKIKPEEFAARWQGAVHAPDTGEYEFVVRTENGARLWVNDLARPLIDAAVRSGADTERRASLRLLGGRAYPVRLEFFKSKEAKEKTASVALAWKPPHGVTETVPARHLSPGSFPETFVGTTPFPPDDRSLGWERGTAISKAWDQATTDAALEAAGYVAARLDDLAGARGDDRAARAREFCRRFAERAFRRPLTDEQKRLFIDRQLDATPDLETGVKRVVLLVLKSPRFLYREAGAGPDGHDVACRLSFALWDSLPDAELLDAAAAGRLATREQVARQAERMLADPRARAKLREFLLVWLRLDPPAELAKDPKRFPGFDAALAADLRTSLDLFLDEVVWGDGSDFRRFLLADHVYLNGRLAKFYGAELPADAPFQKVKLDPEKRAGVLTHPYLAATFAYTGSSSPIHRGVFLARGVLGVSLRPPPEAFAPLAEDLHPKLTTRERVALQTRPGACQSCHAVINPLGFPLEHFDAAGRFRDKDNGQPIDATGSYHTRAGETVTFDGARALAEYLAGSEEAHAAFAERLFQHLVKQPVRAYGPRLPDELRQSFARNGFSVRKLAVEAATVAALHGTRKPPDPGKGE